MSRPSDMPTAERFPHGTRARYVCGCRCDDCRRANRAYSRRRTKEIIFHGKNPLVDAAAVRAHLVQLSRQGVGKRALCDASDVSRSIIDEVLNGKKRHLRRKTAEKLLAVTPDAIADRALVPARKTWWQIRWLLREGFTKRELARRLGSVAETPALQLREQFITARNAARVDRLFRIVTAGDPNIIHGEKASCANVSGQAAPTMSRAKIDFVQRHAGARITTPIDASFASRSTAAERAAGSAASRER